MSYKLVRRAVERGGISLSQMQSQEVFQQGVKYLGTGAVIWQVWQKSVIHTHTHLCAIFCPSKRQKLLSTSLASPPESYPAYGLVWVVTLKGRAGSKRAGVICRFSSSGSLLTLKSLKAAFLMKNNFYLVLSTCIVAQTNSQTTTWVHALIICPPQRAINHE